jgi:hypothetical protein
MRTIGVPAKPAVGIAGWEFVELEATHLAILIQHIEQQPGEVFFLE